MISFLNWQIEKKKNCFGQGETKLVKPSDEFVKKKWLHPKMSAVEI